MALIVYGIVLILKGLALQKKKSIFLNAIHENTKHKNIPIIVILTQGYYEKSVKILQKDN